MKEQTKKILRKLVETKSVRINFICSGNIIRSPYAEILFDHLIKDETMDIFKKIQSESGGVRYRNSSISGESTIMLLKEGVSKKRIKQFVPRYFPDYPNMFDSVDLILVMEQSHLGSIPSQHKNKAHLLLNFVYGRIEDVPDPYFDPPYERSFQMIKKALEDLIVEFKLVSN